jgi:hypothetical protein
VKTVPKVLKIIIEGTFIDKYGMCWNANLKE